MKFSLVFISTACIAITTSLAVPIFYAIDHGVITRAVASSEQVFGRQAALVAEAFATLVPQIIGGIKNGKAMDEQTRGAFTQTLVGKMHDDDPSFNYVVCHTAHDKQFDGQEGKDWMHSHQEVDVKIGGTIGFEVYKFKSGKFIRKGDGGYLNWAYMGNIIHSSPDGKELTFAAAK